MTVTNKIMTFMVKMLSFQTLCVSWIPCSSKTISFWSNSILWWNYECCPEPNWLLIKRGSFLTLYLHQLILKERFGGRIKTTGHNIEIRAGIMRCDVRTSRCGGSTYYYSFLNLAFIFIGWCWHSVNWIPCSSKTISFWSNPSLGIWWRICHHCPEQNCPWWTGVQADTAANLKERFGGLRRMTAQFVVTRAGVIIEDEGQPNILVSLTWLLYL